MDSSRSLTPRGISVYDADVSHISCCPHEAFEDCNQTHASSSPRFHIQDYVADAARAVRFIKSNGDKYGIDPERLAISGSSSGGYIALMVATQRREGDLDSDDPVERQDTGVRVAGCFFPLTDLSSFGEPNENLLDFMQRKYGKVPPAFQFYSSDTESDNPTLIGERDELTRLLREFSPISNVSSDAPPVMLIHGDADAFVSVDQSKRMIDKLKSVDVATRLVIREGKSHAWQGWESDSRLLVAWFDEHLASDATK